MKYIHWIYLYATFIQSNLQKKNTTTKDIQSLRG